MKSLTRRKIVLGSLTFLIIIGAIVTVGVLLYLDSVRHQANIDSSSKFANGTPTENSPNANTLSENAHDLNAIFNNPTSSTIFSDEELYTFVNFKKENNKWRFYFNKDIFKFYFLYRWLKLHPNVEKPKLLFFFDDETYADIVQVIYYDGNIPLYQWQYSLK